MLMINCFIQKIAGKLLLLSAANEGGQNSREKLHGYIKYEEKASLKPLAINVRACVCVCKNCKVSEKSEPRRKIDKIISNSGTLAHLKLNTRNRLHTQTHTAAEFNGMCNSYARLLIKLLLPTASATVTTLTKRRSTQIEEFYSKKSVNVQMKPERNVAENFILHETFFQQAQCHK